MNELHQTMIAYYAAGPANDLTIADRWYPYGELLLIIEDKFSIATRKFGIKVRGQSKPAATAFLDAMIEKGAWATKENEYGGRMHQFQSDKFRAAIKEMQASDPAITEAQGQGPEFWEARFASLTA
jgi:hypothetical protein